jgi:uncharacterized protein (PEP-CTERM system associated)
MALAFAPVAHARNWNFQPYVSGSAIYTDNQNQSATDPQDAVILTVTPGFSLYSEGSRRLRVGMNYGVTGVARFGENLDNEFMQSLNAIANAELIEDFLFIDATAGISQQLISLTGSQVDAAINSSNRTPTGTYSISPYLKHRFGSFAEGTARFTQSGALFQDSTFNDINSSTINASLASGTRFNTLSWGLNYSYQNAIVQNSDNVSFESYGANLGYALTRQFRLLGTVGYDKNDYATAAPGADVSGSYWTGGFGWTPNRRTNLEASIGESYTGRTYGLNFNYRSHHSVWTATYNDGVGDIAQQLLNTDLLYVWSCDGGLFYGDAVMPPAGQANCVIQGTAPIGTAPVGLSNGVYLSKSLQGGVAWSKRRTSLGLSVFNTRRQYLQLVGEPEDETWGINATYGYNLQPHTTLNAGLGYNNNQVPATLSGTATAESTDYYTASLGVSHQFGRDLSGALIVQHLKQDSNVPANSYDENIITASARMTF